MKRTIFLFIVTVTLNIMCANVTYGSVSHMPLGQYQQDVCASPVIQKRPLLSEPASESSSGSDSLLCAPKDNETYPLILLPNSVRVTYDRRNSDAFPYSIGEIGSERSTGGSKSPQTDSDCSDSLFGGSPRERAQSMNGLKS
ncbi:MAG: hypothetical protein K6C34_04265 [Alphaproteobacteria bacterium]|nr:hypothetical protein [Alphaproteobacteria bacterium]